MNLMWKHLAQFVSLLALLSALASSTGCEGLRGTAGPAAPEAPPDPAAEGIEFLRVGDRITVILSDAPGPPPGFAGAIRDDGKIVLHLNQEFTAAGKRASDLEKEIHDRFVPSIYKRLTVSVKAEERSFFVYGEVRGGGQKPYFGEMNVLKAIATAGGFTDFAARKRVRVIRAGGKTVVVNCKKALTHPKENIPIYPGDTIYVDRSPL
jgi:polysaccharide export outer membrane protein